MGENSQGSVRVIRKWKKEHGSHHGGAWKVAYADFVTAMMAFFLVMWILGLNQNIKSAVAAYFQDPTGFMKAVEAGGKAFDGKGGGGNAVINIMPNVAKKPYQQISEQDIEKKRFEQVKKAVENMIQQYPQFKILAKSIQIKITKDGMRIDLVESSGDVFFDSGSAQTKPRTRELLRKIASELGKLPNWVIIEGHTDSRPYKGPHGWTNWELSTARANAARAIMESSGLKKGQMLEVRGLADRMPVDLKHPESYRNRRVSILIPFQNTTQNFVSVVGK